MSKSSELVDPFANIGDWDDCDVCGCKVCECPDPDAELVKVCPACYNEPEACDCDGYRANELIFVSRDQAGNPPRLCGGQSMKT
jgi:hypothetical protein